jgi:intracellular sulfur oxidation DsrE/DsrF family protein
MTEKLDRRALMTGIGAAAAGVALGGTIVSAETPQAPPQAAQPVSPFQPARHAVDAWFDTIPGKHRVILDNTSADNTGGAIQYAGNFYAANLSGYQVANADIALVLCLRHFATIFAYNNAMWAKYGTQLANAGEYKDPKATEFKTNPRNSGERPALDNLAKRGAHFAVCGLATQFFARTIAGQGGDWEAVNKELSANLIPNAHMMSAGVVAIARAQEYGYSLIHVG